jgi:hypothetical protein
MFNRPSLGSNLVHPFAYNDAALPWATGRQFVKLGAGAAEYPNGGAPSGHLKPWPYLTSFFSFITGYPYGDATTLAAMPNIPNLWAGHAPNRPIGYEKPQTGAFQAF